ncbi:MAG: hypothetical protein WBL61_01685 [Bryobacteraceae bacterium]
MKRILLILTVFVALGSMALLAADNPPRAPDGTAAQGNGGTADRVRLLGMLRMSQGKFLLNDENSQVTYELRGKTLEKFQGSKVVVQGRIAKGPDSPSSSPQVVNVVAIQIAGAVAGSGAAAAGVSAGISKGAIIAIAAGAVAAGTVGGLRAADVIGSSGQPVSPP